MLEELRIGGLGVIDDAVLEFAPGLTVVTGETGAGKTMVVTGLALLFGSRADTALVRVGAARAAVDGRIRLPPTSASARRAEDLGADVEDGALVLSRIVGSDGRSRAQVGGRPVPVGKLAEFADDLVAVHGQAEQLRLRAPSAQRDAIDRYGGANIASLLEQYRARYRRWTDVETEVATLRDQARERLREAEVLRYGLTEIEAVDPQPDEDLALAAELSRLSHADVLTTAAKAAHDYLRCDPDRADGVEAVALVNAATNALERAAEHDPVLKGMQTQLAEVGYVLADVAAALVSYVDTVDADPLRLSALQARQAALAALTRKYGTDDAGGVEGVLAWGKQAAHRLAELDGDDTRIAELAAAAAQLHGELRELASALSAARTRAAEAFGAAVTTELRDLAMPHAQVSAQVRRGSELGPHGVDDVELVLSPHAGAPARPLARGASGGELSRAMLAVEVVFGGSDPVPTFVFDEVDAGVGGKAAVEVGRRLARLAVTSQVIVVTHLPQVAAFGDRHLVVVKSDDGTVTRSGVVAVEGTARVEELSRMLAGIEGSKLAKGHARELIDTAGSFKEAL